MLNSLTAYECFWSPEFLEACCQKIYQNPFWQEKNGEVQPLKNDNASLYFSNFLPALGFFKLHTESGFVPVQIKGNLIRIVNENDICEYISYLFNQSATGIAVLDQMTLAHQKFFGKNILTSLRIKTGIKPLKDTRSTSYRFYRNCVIVVKADEVRTMPYEEVGPGTYVFINKIIDRDFELSELMTEEEFLSDVTCHIGNHFYNWCRNLCRFRKENKWIFDQRAFKTLVSGFGYLLHRAWNEQKLVVFTDRNMVSGISNGRTGKSLVLNEAMEHVANTVVVNAKNLGRMTSDKFLFSEVSRETDYICFDDGTIDFPLESLFSTITGNLQVEAKHANKISIHKKDKPKMALSCNHPILGEGFSFTDRQHLVEVSDFYRYHKEELYQDPIKLHGGYLFDDDWGNRNWREFDMFCVYSLRFYLKHGLVGGKASDDYRLAKLYNETGSKELVQILHRFLEDHKNQTVYRKYSDNMDGESVLVDYVMKNATEKFSEPDVVKAFKATAKYYGYQINRGNPDRKQKRFGDDRVDEYLITHSSEPFAG